MLVGALSLLTAPSALAATYIVTRFDDPPPGNCDPNDCSLREAVLAANASVGIADTIQLAAGTYVLSIPGTGEDGSLDGDLDVTNDPLTILGQGRGVTIIDGGGITVGEAAFGLFADTTMDGLTIRNSVSSGNIAGVLVSDGVTYTLDNASITGNSASATGCCAGVYGLNNTALNFTNVDISNNNAPTCCAGIIAGSPTAVTLTNVRITGNTVTSSCCSGITLNGSLNATNLLVDNNFAEPSCCSGIVATFSGPSSLRNTTISNNRAIGNCCGGLTFSGPLSLANTTITGNRADDIAGGIWTSDSLTLNNSTVTGNTANADNAVDGGDEGGGGIFVDGGTVTLQNSILAGNSVGTGAPGPDCFGTIGSAGYNLIGNTADCTFTPSTGDKVGVNPLLGPLADNGGFVPTVPILKGSPAVNGGNPAPPGSGGSACEATDARGLGRNCDIGAYELTFCRKVAVNRIGTPGKDSLRGTSGRDGILGFGGKDALRGKGGKDGLCGGPGKDLLKGGGGKDILDGGPGKDTCVGGPGKDKAKACEVTKTIP
jgi:CSLREA domain-containing protein